MSTDAKAAIRDINANAGTLFKTIPDTMKAFQGLEKASHQGEALEQKTKELIALAISIALRCDDCIAYHASAALRHGASRAEAAEAIAVAIQMGGGPGVVYGGKAIKTVDELAGGTG